MLLLNVKLNSCESKGATRADTLELRVAVFDFHRSFDFGIVFFVEFDFMI